VISEQNRRFHVEKNYMAVPLDLGELRLVQIGRTHCSRDYTVNPHIHGNWFELTHVIDGRGEIITNGISVPVKTGDIYLSFPGDIHAIRTDREAPLKFHFLSLWPQDPAVLAHLETIMLMRNDPAKRCFWDENVEYLISSCIAELFTDDAYSKEILCSALYQILHYVIRALAGAQKPQRLAVNLAQELCYQLMNYINTHIYVLDSLEDLSRVAGYSYSYLSDLFRKTTGDTLTSYYTKRRMDVAAMLLKEDGLTIGEVGERLRYSSIYAFSRAFRNHFGVSPSQYRSNSIQYAGKM